MMPLWLRIAGVGIVVAAGILFFVLFLGLLDLAARNQETLRRKEREATDSSSDDDGSTDPNDDFLR
jgi:hypothetical protein